MSLVLCEIGDDTEVKGKMFSFFVLNLILLFSQIHWQHKWQSRE